MIWTAGSALKIGGRRFRASGAIDVWTAGSVAKAGSARHLASGAVIDAEEPPVQPPGHFGGVSAGPAGGPGYDIERLARNDELLARLRREDDEILHAITTIVTSGILNGNTDQLH